MNEELEYLKSVRFDKYLKKINNKLKNKKILIYGTGLLFQTIIKHYDLSNLNIIGISDKKYLEEDEGKQDLGYNIILRSKIVNYKPDYILVATLKFLSIIDYFQNKEFKGTGIKILPLVDKPFFSLLKDVLK